MAAYVFSTVANIINPTVNQLYNSTMAGATSSTFPTQWAGTAGGGITPTVVGTGTENGFNYIDVSLIGTPTSTSTLYVSIGNVTYTPATPGSAWTFSIYDRIVSGSLTNLICRPTLNEYGGGFLGSVFTNDTPTSTMARVSVTLPNAVASTTNVYATYAFVVQNGLAVNVVLRLYAPQLETGTVATTFVPTSSGTSTGNVPATLKKSTVKNLLGTSNQTTQLQRVINKVFFATAIKPTKNLIPNSTMVGAVGGSPGTLPTNWNIYNPAAVPLTLAYGVENGLNYIDVLVNTTTVGGANIQIQYNGIITIAGGVGTQVTLSSVYKLVAGSMTGANVHLQLDEYASGSYLVSYGSGTTTLTGTPVTAQYPHVMTGPTATGVIPMMSLSLGASTTFNFEFRIYAPQLELGAIATAFVPTSGSAATGNPPATMLRAISRSLFNSVSQNVLFVRGRNLFANIIKPTTNLVQNSSFAGTTVGTPGNAPNHMSIYNPGGLTVNVSGYGTEFGLPYIELNVSGTTGATTLQLLTLANADVSALPGQNYTLQGGYRLTGGTTANISSVGLLLDEYNSLTFLIQGISAGPALSSSLQNTTYTYTTTQATVNTVIGGFRIGFAGTGLTVAFTIRLYAPQVELGASATPFISTTGGIATGNPPATLIKSAGKLALANISTIASRAVSISKFLMTYMVKPTVNLVIQSQNFLVSWGFSGNGSLTAAAATAPDGTNTATQYVSTAPYAWLNTPSSGTLAGKEYCASIYVKYVSGSSIFYIFYGDGTSANGILQVFDISAGTKYGSIAYIGAGTDGSSTITSVGNGWYRISTSGAIPGINGTIVCANTTLTNTMYIWGAQLELGSVPTAYVPTTTAIVTGNYPAIIGKSLARILNAAMASSNSLIKQTGKVLNNPVTTQVLIRKAIAIPVPTQINANASLITATLRLRSYLATAVTSSVINVLPVWRPRRFITFLRNLRTPI